MIGIIRKTLRSIKVWVYFQEMRREGFSNFYKRVRIQRKVLSSPPVLTEISADVEIHVLTWRKDYLNLIWSLKTFYKLSKVNFPLVIHDGGLERGQAETLLRHFPKARFIEKGVADKEVENHLKKENKVKSILYRRTNVATLKLFDYKYYSQAKRILHIDSDVVFFKKPKELLSYVNSSTSVFNKDMSYAYSIDNQELKKLARIEVPSFINSGLFMIDADSIDLDIIEKSLSESSALFENKWVTEQTLHAICAANNGFKFLSDDYLISTLPGLGNTLVCKHYTGFFRPLFYQEGLVKIVKDRVISL